MGEGCWEWTGVRDRAGYGLVWLPDHSRPAHRLAYWLAYGPFDETKKVCHHCDNPPCARPDHLFVGTDKDNHNDRDRKGRVAHGETHYMAKLTQAQVNEIRARRGPYGTGKRLAEEFGVSRSVISMIWNNRIWQRS